MITKLHIENFKCLRDVTVELQPLTVLIGKNDTGKTSFLEALGVLGGLVRRDGAIIWPDASIDNVISRGAAERKIQWRAEVSPSSRFSLPGPAAYALSLGFDRGAFRVVDEQLTVEGREIGLLRVEQQGGLHRTLTEAGEQYGAGAGVEQSLLSLIAGRPEFPVSAAVAAALTTTDPYRFDPRQLTIKTAFAPPKERPDTVPVLGPTGHGLSAVLDFLLGARRKVFDQIERELSEAVPQVKGIQLKPAASGEAPGSKSISFELAGGHDIPATMASDGVLLLLAYLTLIHAPGAPAVIRLEEPENGIHPRQLERVAGYLKRLTDARRGANAAQIVVATHSPYFLDFVPPESVVVFGRRENGDTVTAPLLSLPGVKERIASGFSLGEMWLNVGEDELLADLLK